MLDFNDSRFAPSLILDSVLPSGDVPICGYIWIGNPNTSPTHSLIGALAPNVGAATLAPSAVYSNGISTGNIIAVVLNDPNGIAQYCAIPSTNEQLIYNNHNGIPISNGQPIALYTSPFGIEPWIEINFSQQTNSVFGPILPYFPQAGVLNPTGLSNGISYDFGVSAQPYSGTPGPQNVNISYNTTGTCTQGGGLGSYAGNAMTFNASVTNNNSMDILFNVGGPGTLSITFTATATGPYASYCAVYLMVNGVQNASFSGAGTYTFTYTPSAFEFDNIDISIQSSSSTTYAVNFTSVYFFPSSVSTTSSGFNDLIIDQTHYDLYNTRLDNAYDVTTIKGLINAFNAICGPTCSDPTRYILTAGWSFGGKLILQHRYKGSSSMTLQSPFSIASGHQLLLTALSANGVTINSINVQQDSGNNITSNNAPIVLPNLAKGVALTLPLVPADVRA